MVEAEGAAESAAKGAAEGAAEGVTTAERCANKRCRHRDSRREHQPGTSGDPRWLQGHDCERTIPTTQHG